MKQLFVRHRHAGFTLLELLVVIAIVGILAAVSLPRFADFRAAAYDARAQQDLRNLASAQELYRAGNDSYADTLDVLAAFRGSDGVTVAIATADADDFTASAVHSSGQQQYSWDSAAEPQLSAERR